MTDGSRETADPRRDDWRRTWHAVRDALGSKWAFHVVRALADRELGFNDLKRELDGVTAKTLSERLRELRCLGFVEKEVHATSPPTTTYRLTDHGRSLADIMADVESLVEVVACPDGDCPVPSAGAHGDVCKIGEGSGGEEGEGSRETATACEPECACEC